MKAIWYKDYKTYSTLANSYRSQFLARCKELGGKPEIVLQEVWNELIAKAVHESNWQEGMKLDEPRTMELANDAYDDLQSIAGPHLDMRKILDFHRDRVLQMKKKSASVEEIAAYNLSIAHHSLRFLRDDLRNRHMAIGAKALSRLKRYFKVNRRFFSPEQQKANQRDLRIVERPFKLSGPIQYPLTHEIKNIQEYMRECMKLPDHSLEYPMSEDYIHFLHRITMMGILNPQKCGRFRRIGVHIGVENVQFPPPSLVIGLMKEYCRTFMQFTPKSVELDLILNAAIGSYEFVRIHPYSDGNGRVARLLMNLLLLLYSFTPPVYLKSDKTGRRRYSYALKLANRGNAEPLACLIAMSLVNVYKKMIEATKSIYSA